MKSVVFIFLHLFQVCHHSAYARHGKSQFKVHACLQHGPWVRAGLPRLTKPNLELNPSLRKRRAQHREKAHKAAISEAIRKKWADPAYRERVLKGKSVRSEANGKVLPFSFQCPSIP